jgi:hypothetical protein
MEPFGTCHFSQINEDMHHTDLRLGVRENLGQSPLFDPSQQPPRHHLQVEEKMILQVTETNHKDQARSCRRSHRPKSNPEAHYSHHPPWHLRVRAAEEILGSAPQRRPHDTSSSTCRLRHASATTRSPFHLFAIACLLCPLPFGDTGAATADGGGSGQGDGRRMWLLELVWGLHVAQVGATQED